MGYNMMICVALAVAVIAFDIASGGLLGGGGGGGGYPRGGPGGFGPGSGGGGGGRPSTNYGAPSGGFGGGGGGYNGGGGGGGGYNGGGGGGGYNGGGGGGGKPEPYSFQYAVKDPQSGNDYSQQENSDGHTVRGEYSVLLPDGRTQIVKYTADDANGFVADVQYQGTAHQGGGGYGGGGNYQGGGGGGKYQGGGGGGGNYQGGGGGGGNYQGSNSYLPPNYKK